MSIVAEQSDIYSVLRRHAAAQPDRVFLTTAELCSRQYTYREFQNYVDRVATGLAGLGVTYGSFVNVMLANSAEYLAVSYALRRLGAIEVAINCEARGPALARMFGLAKSSVGIVGDSFAEALASASAELRGFETIVVVGDVQRFATACSGGAKLSGLRELIAGTVGTPPLVEVNPLDPAMVIFTSGTTGPSKGCLLSHRSLVRSGESIVQALELTANDRVYAPYPLFHGRASALDVLGTLLAGAQVVLAPRFSASAFWPDMQRFEVSVFSIIGTVMQILWKQPPSDLDRQHRVRIAWGGPITVAPDAFMERFGIKVLPGESVFGMTETGMLNMSSFDPRSNGRIRSIYEVIIADEHDAPLKSGEVGEILVRPREPGVMFSGYLGMPEATVAACRNLWFHTGDLGRMDDCGRMTFVGRKRDMIRSAGHNISPAEVEEVLASHPSIVESAVIGVPSSLGEEDVAAFVVTRQRGSLTDAIIRDFCDQRMARFMVPRHVVFVDSLPKTQTGKVARAELLAQALSQCGLKQAEPR